MFSEKWNWRFSAVVTGMVVALLFLLLLTSCVSDNGSWVILDDGEQIATYAAREWDCKTLPVADNFDKDLIVCVKKNNMSPEQYWASELVYME